MSVKSFYSGGREWFGRKARNIEGLSYFYLFIFILPPYNTIQYNTVTEIIQRFIRWQELKPKETMIEAFTTWAFSTKLQNMLNINSN